MSTYANKSPSSSAVESALNSASLNEFIKQKEKELHEINMLRCTHLEDLVKERDELLVDSVKRFEQLKEDFQYNITLIEARDEEIQRLDRICKEKAHQCEMLESQNREISAKLEAITSSQKEKDSKRELEKIANKRILDELRDVIDSMRWASDEELRTKNREIDQLRSEIQASHIQREESLESQRKDLTDAFEHIIQMRENSFAEKERHIAEQIMQLERRFEQLQTENSRLKSDLSDSQNDNEKLSTALSRAEEARCQLQWQLEDERSQKIASDDSMKRTIHKLNLDISFAKESAAKRTFELENEIEKMSLELARQTDFRGVLERRIEELKSVSQQDLTALEKELSEDRRLIAILQQELNSVKEEKEIASSKATSIRMELEALEASYRVASRERDIARDEASSLSTALAESTALRDNLHSDMVQHLSESKQRELKLINELAEQKASYEKTISQQKEKIDSLRAECEHSKAAVKDLEEATEALRRELSAQQSSRQSDADKQLQEKEKEEGIRELEKQLQQAREGWQNEKTEAAALRLRLQLYENSSSQRQQQRSQQHRQQRSPKLPPRNKPPANDRRSLAVVIDDYSYDKGSDQAEDDDEMEERKSNGRQLLSPAFSEDLGPASFSSSMLGMPLSPSPPSQSPSPPSSPPRPYVQSEDPRRTERDRNERRFSSPSTKRNTNLNKIRPSSVMIDDERVTALMEENERLKKVVREMREDVEALKNPNPNPNPHPNHRIDRPKTENEQESNLKEASSAVSTQPSSSSIIGNQEGAGATALATLPPPVNANSYDILERRLKQTVDEVSRLKTERKRLMDVSNELRSALNKKENSETFSYSSASQPAYMDPQLRVMPVPPPPPPHAYLPSVPATGLGLSRSPWELPVPSSSASLYSYSHPQEIPSNNALQYHTKGPALTGLQGTIDIERDLTDISLQGQSLAKRNSISTRNGSISRPSSSNSISSVSHFTVDSRNRGGRADVKKLAESEKEKKVRTVRPVMNYAKKPDND